MQEILTWQVDLLRWVSAFLRESLWKLGNLVHTYNSRAQEMEAELGIQSYPALCVLGILEILRSWRKGGREKRETYDWVFKSRDGQTQKQPDHLKTSKEPAPDTKPPSSFPYESNEVASVKESNVSLW